MIKGHPTVTQEIVNVMFRILGAILGSSVAVIFRHSEESGERIVDRWLIGLIIGSIFAPHVLNYMNWPNTWDYWLSSGAVMGLLGYLLMRLLFSEALYSAIQKKITGDKR